MPSATASTPVSRSTRQLSSLRSRLRPGSDCPHAHNRKLGVLRRTLGDVAVLAAEELALVLDLREQRDRASPHLRGVAQRIPRLASIEIGALVDVAEQQLAAVREVAVLDDDHRLAAVGQHLQQLILHLLELAAHDLPVARALLEAERIELLVDTELEREELVEERDVVVELADLEQLLAAEPGAALPVLLEIHRVALVPLFTELALVPAVLDVAEQLDAELVRIELAR